MLRRTKMQMGFGIVGVVLVALGFFFIFVGKGGRATAIFALGRGSLTFRGTLGAVFIFMGLIFYAASIIL